MPEVVLGPIGGILADRVDRRRLMIGADAARATTMVGLAVVAATQAPIVLAPLLAALPPPPDRPTRRASWPSCRASPTMPCCPQPTPPGSRSPTLCIIAGPAVRSRLLFLARPAITFAVNASTFLSAIALVVALPREALRRPARSRRSTASDPLPTSPSAGRRFAASDDASVRRRRRIVSSAVYGALTVVLVLLAVRLGLASAGYGYLLSASAPAPCSGPGLALRAAHRDRPRGPLAAARSRSACR